MGKLLGGGSSINLMVWSRRHKNDWEFFAAETTLAMRCGTCQETLAARRNVPQSNCIVGQRVSHIQRGLREGGDASPRCYSR